MWLDRFRSYPQQEKPLASPTACQARATRFKLDLPVSFSGDGRTHEGRCINVSETGLLARCDDLPDLWTDGRLALEAGEHYLTIRARVARLQGKDVGFAFAITDDNDRAAISLLIAAVSDCPLPEEAS